MPLILDLDIGDSVRIGADTVVHVERKSGSRVRLSFDSEYKIRLERGSKPERPDASKIGKTTLERPKLP